MIRSPLRRLAAIAAIGVLAGGAVTACRSDAGAAAWVGGTRISSSQVETIAGAVPNQGADRSSARVTVVTLKVFNTAAAKFAASRHIDAPAVTDAQINQAASAQRVDPADIPARRPWLELVVTTNGWVSALTSSEPAATPTEADYQRLFTELQADFQPGTTFSQAKQTFQQIPGLAQGIALRNELEPVLKSYHISISPRYANACAAAPCPAPYIPLVQVQGPNGPIDVVNLALTERNASPAAIDLPASVPNVSIQG